MRDLQIDGNSLAIEDIVSILDGDVRVGLSEKAKEKMIESRKVIQEIIQGNDVVYGINTGFGSLSSVTIDTDDLEELQANLIRSHACGVGEKMKSEHVIMMM